MILGEYQKFASPEEALQHVGIKGMKWGVRKNEERTASRPSITQTEAEKKAIRRARAKKIAIGTGALVAIAGAGFVAYKLHQSGNLPISSLRKAGKNKAATKAVEKVFSEQTEIIHVARQRNKGYSFFKKGGIPNYFEETARLFKEDQAPIGFFDKVTDGRIAVRMLDPQGRRDFAGRPIQHDIIIPKRMASGINSIDDVVKNIWPSIAAYYDPIYDAPGR